MERVKKCPVCDKVIPVRRKFCSSACAIKFHSKPGNSIIYNHVCKYCSTPFQSDKPRSSYCKPSCRTRAYERTRKKRNTRTQSKHHDDGVRISETELFSGNLLQYEYNRKQVIAKSREKPLEGLVQLSARTWVIPRNPNSDKDQVKAQVKAIFTNNQNQF